MRYSVPRKSRRVPLLADIHLKLEELPDPATEKLQNLSLGGMSVGIQRPSAVGSLVAFEFKIGEALIEGTGEVVWNRDGRAGVDKGPAMGIRFRYLSPGSRERIFRLVQWYANQEGEVTAEAVAAAAASGLPAPARRGGAEADGGEGAGEGDLQESGEEAPPAAPAPAAAIPGPLPPAFQPEVPPPPAGDPGPAVWRSWPEAPEEAAAAPSGLPDLPLEPALSPGDLSHQAAPAVRRPPPVQHAAYASSESWRGRLRWLVIALVVAALIIAALRYGGQVLDWLTTLGEGGPAAMAAPQETLPPAARMPAARPAATRIAPSGTAPSGTAPSGTAPSGTAPSGTAPSGTASGSAAVPGSSPQGAPAAAPAGPPAMDEITVVAAAAPEGSPPARPPADRAAEAPIAAAPSPAPAVAAASLAVPREPAPAASAARPARSSPLRNVERISWQQAGGGTVVEIAGDGSLAARQYSSLRLEGEAPRLLIRIRGVERPYSPETIRAGSPELTAIRSALHLQPGGNELHVVLDLASPRVAVSRIEETAAGLRILLQLPS
jgi:PilZ domain